VTTRVNLETLSDRVTSIPVWGTCPVWRFMMAKATDLMRKSTEVDVIMVTAWLLIWFNINESILLFPIISVNSTVNPIFVKKSLSVSLFSLTYVILLFDRFQIGGQNGVRSSDCGCIRACIWGRCGFLPCRTCSQSRTPADQWRKTSNTRIPTCSS